MPIVSKLQMDAARHKLLRSLDLVIRPHNMAQADTLEFLEELRADIQSRIEDIQDAMKNR